MIFHASYLTRVSSSCGGGVGIKSIMGTVRGKVHAGGDSSRKAGKDYMSLHTFDSLAYY